MMASPAAAGNAGWGYYFPEPLKKAPPSKRPRYDAVFRAEALRLASESRLTLAAARALTSNAKLLYAWYQAAQ